MARGRETSGMLMCDVPLEESFPHIPATIHCCSNFPLPPFPPSLEVICYTSANKLSCLLSANSGVASMPLSLGKTTSRSKQASGSNLQYALQMQT